MPKELDKYKDAFLSEAKEHVASMNKSLLKLEKDPAKLELVNDIFREAHTLKSMAATMGYNKTSTLCHAIEDVLDVLKKKKMMQYNIMQSRMVPIGFVFNRFPRMVRDLAKSQKKEVNLEMQGSDIELDRGVIDEIGESLVHLIRNSIDHGIETPEARKKVDKPPQGTIMLTATSTKNSAIISVSDDGAGLDLEDIKNTAIKRGIISAGASKEEIMASIFSGLSTTKQVTTVSGRGFGLDIVKNKIESLGGTIRAESEPKKGTTFTIEMPLTLAIIKTLFVEVGGKPYAIPLVNIERLVTVNQKDIKGMINYEAIVLNEEDIPITRLDVLFDVPSLNLEKQPIAIIRKDSEKLGLAVDFIKAN